MYIRFVLAALRLRNYLFPNRTRSMNTTSESIGVWSLLPNTISPQARAIAQAQRLIPRSKSFPANRAEWQVRNDAYKAGVASAAMEQVLNIKPCKSRKVVIDGAEHTLFYPDHYDESKDRRLIVHVHGGGYVLGAPECEKPAATPIVASMNCPVLSIRYPLWWEESPGADVDRVIAIYRELRKERDASSIALMGASAGAGLVLRATLKLHQLGEQMPAVLALATPWTDVGGSGDTARTLSPYDIIDTRVHEIITGLVGSAELLNSPAISPIYADYPSNFPPSILATGTRDSLLSDSARLQRKLIKAGIPHELHVFEGMPHGFMGFRIPEADACMHDFSVFLKKYLG